MSSLRSQTATVPPSPPLCPKCHERPVLVCNGHAQGYCRPCHATYKREWYRSHKAGSKRCEHCGQPLPHGGKCPELTRQAFVRRGRSKLNEQWPGYGDALTDERWLEKIGHSWPKCAGPPPSFVFGLPPSFDQRLIDAGKDKDVTFCRTLANVPSGEQREYLDLALVDPVDAAKWLSLPPYQRPIRKGDRDDDAIWRFFTMQRLNMNLAAEGRAWELKSQGAQLPQMFGMIDRLSMAGVKKLVLVMNAYGYALQDGKPLGNVTKKPWD